MLKRSCWALVPILFAQAALGADVRLQGRIVGETGTPVAGAKIDLKLDGVTVHAVSDPTGAFVAVLPSTGNYEIEVDREGYFLLTNRKVNLNEGLNEVQFVLNRVRELVESIDVSANPGAVDMDRTTPQISLTGNDLLSVPYPSTNTLRNALRIMPGVVQDGRGGVHMQGGAEEQTLYTLEGFQINDPLSGRFESRVSVESVQSLEATAGRPRAEFGKGSSGVLAIRSRSGDDKLRYSATNFVPGIEHQKDWMIGGWSPRGNISGPWKSGRAWFSNSTDLQYVSTVIRELPQGQDRTSSWRGSNLLHNQINLTPSNILTIGSLVNYWYAPRTGLSALDPRETTLDRRSRQLFTYVKDQIYFTRGALLEFGFAANRTWGREVPQGEGLYVVTPFARGGNNFLDASRRGGRDQLLTNVFLPARRFFGEHQMKTGVDLDRVNYWQDVKRTGIQFADVDFTPIRQTLFYGNGSLHRNNYEASTYVQDSWRVRPHVLLELGLRTDWDSALRNWNLSPRLGFAWSPKGLENTKISGGFARIFDPTSLRILTRPQDQFSASTYFASDGMVTRGPALSLYRNDNSHLASPRYHNWNLGVEQRFPKLIQARLNFISRRGSRGFTYLNGVNCQCFDLPSQVGGFQNPQFDAIYLLSTQRNDRYNAVEVTLRQPIRQQYEWLFSYTRSRATSNAVMDQSIDEPLLIRNNSGAMPWDTPNRWLSWGFLPTPFKNWSIAYLAEYRTGFPFSVQDKIGQLDGQLNAYRYPAFFELNLHLEKRLLFHGYWWALRGGFNNITGHNNPNVVNNVIGSPEFLQMFGGQSRAFNVRVRWLGKQ